MPNVLTGNPLYFDSTSSAAITGKYRIQSIVWSNPASANDAVAVVNGASKALWGHTWQASSATYIPVHFPAGLKTSGLKVTTLDSGKLFVYGERI